MYRNTYVEINLKNIENNVRNLINTFNDYQYYFGVVKADCYGHGFYETVKSIVKGGCNYLAVATLDEALDIRKEMVDIPILCLGIVPLNYIEECKKNNITITISNLKYLEDLLKLNVEDLKVHLKVNTGMNRLGVKTKDEFNIAYDLISKSKLELEGIYSHVYFASNTEKTNNQFRKFEDITADIDLEKIKIVHISASDAMINYSKLPYTNGCRLGIAMYGFSDSKSLELGSTFSLYSEVIQINEIENETVGYNGIYEANGKEKIAVVPIGYADGVIRKNTGRYVYINDKKYPIIGNVCMDMLFVKIDDMVKVNDKVIILKDVEHIEEIAKHLDTISYEVMCSVSKRVPRIYLN